MFHFFEQLLLWLIYLAREVQQIGTLLFTGVNRAFEGEVDYDNTTIPDVLTRRLCLKLRLIIFNFAWKVLLSCFRDKERFWCIKSWCRIKSENEKIHKPWGKLFCSHFNILLKLWWKSIISGLRPTLWVLNLRHCYQITYQRQRIRLISQSYRRTWERHFRNESNEEIQATVSIAVDKI